MSTKKIPNMLDDKATLDILRNRKSKDLPRPMPWRAVCHFIAQGAINIAEGHTTIEHGSPVSIALEDFCAWMTRIDDDLDAQKLLNEALYRAQRASYDREIKKRRRASPEAKKRRLKEMLDGVDAQLGRK